MFLFVSTWMFFYLPHLETGSDINRNISKIAIFAARRFI